jgi:hypothetical protein
LDLTLYAYVAEDEMPGGPANVAVGDE